MFTTRHKVVHNGGSPNFKGSSFDKKTTYMAQILQSLSCKVYFITLAKLDTLGLFILILGASAIMDQTGCCYNMTTSEISLYPTSDFCKIDHPKSPKSTSLENEIVSLNWYISNSFYRI